MPDFFISYSRVDRKFAERFRNLLLRQTPGSSVFLDSVSLYGGQDWWDEILDNIEKCDIFFYLLSNDSVQSRYCRTEFEFAQQLGKPIITVMIRDRTNVPDEIAAIQRVDMTPDTDEAEAMASIGGAIQLQLAKGPRRTISTTRPQKPSGPSTESPVPPTPTAASPSSRKSPWWQDPQYLLVVATVAAAVITGVFGLLPILLSPDDDSSSATEPAASSTPTETPTATGATLAAIVDQTTTGSPVMPTATTRPTATDTPSPMAADQVSISAGTYDLPNGRIRIDAFVIDRMEVASEDFHTFLSQASFGSDAMIRLNAHANPVSRLPMRNVNQAEAAAYCEWAGGQLPNACQFALP